jgi:4-nitrophenyl phosphatase
MAKIKCFVIDLDGVVYTGNTLVKNADKRIVNMRQKGRVFFVTNNASLHREEYVKKLHGFGIPVVKDEILTSAYVSAVYINTHYDNPQVFMIGEKGLRQELEEQDIKVCHRNCNLVLVGLDRGFNYDKLALALRYVEKGAPFLATNDDNALVTESGLLPGAGAIVSALRTASRKEPIIIGKPSDIMADFILTKAGVKPEEVLLIGDRLDTEVVMGKNFGMKTALVLTGYTKQEDLEKSKIRPDYVLEGL